MATAKKVRVGLIGVGWIGAHHGSNLLGNPHAELAAVCAQLGRIPSKEEYLAIAAEKIDPYGAELYRYLNFDQIEGFEDAGRVVSAEEEAKVLAGV